VKRGEVNFPHTYSSGGLGRKEEIWRWEVLSCYLSEPGSLEM
jgi:hypothetical protein